jgi:hypothetical protein
VFRLQVVELKLPLEVELAEGQLQAPEVEVDELLLEVLLEDVLEVEELELLDELLEELEELLEELELLDELLEELLLEVAVASVQAGMFRLPS